MRIANVRSGWIAAIACAAVLGAVLGGGCGGAPAFRSAHGQITGPVGDSPLTVGFPAPGDRWSLRTRDRDGLAWVLAPTTIDPGARAAPPDGLLFVLAVAGRQAYWECVDAGPAGLRACLETTLRAVDFQEIRFDDGAPAEEAAPAGPAHRAGFAARRAGGRFAGDLHLVLVDRASGVVAIVIGAGATPDAVREARSTAARLRDSIRFDRR